MNRLSVTQFQSEIWQYYNVFGRSFPWRETDDVYQILVSEIMLQQTQTYRVEPKYKEFLGLFPTVQVLAASPLESVIRAWQGLGYNRRAKFLHLAAKKVVEEYDGNFPIREKELRQLPGIGEYTAAAVTAFAYNTPTVFIETNIRTVFIHFFFADSTDVHDAEIRPLVAEYLDEQNPREWYYALMDYGVRLKKEFPILNKKSAHYARQSQYEGSNRQVRSLIIKHLLNHPNTTLEQLVDAINDPEQRVSSNINAMVKEGLLRVLSNKYSIEG